MLLLLASCPPSGGGVISESSLARWNTDRTWLLEDATYRLVMALPDYERTIVVRRFRLDSTAELGPPSYSDVAYRLGKSAESVRLTCKAVLESLRQGTSWPPPPPPRVTRPQPTMGTPDAASSKVVIDEYDDLLGPRKLRNLKDSDYKTLADLAAASEQELLAVPGVGKDTIMRIKQILYSEGLLRE